MKKHLLVGYDGFINLTKSTVPQNVMVYHTAFARYPKNNVGQNPYETPSQPLINGHAAPVSWTHYLPLPRPSHYPGHYRDGGKWQSSNIWYHLSNMICIWRFPKKGVPPNSSTLYNGIFHCWPTILGHLHSRKPPYTSRGHGSIG